MRLDLARYAIPPPSDWQAFERLCRDLWAAIWGDPNAQPNGRSGQPQAGVDVSGNRQSDGHRCGVQCKRRGTLADDGKITKKTLLVEVDNAKSFEPPLTGEFVLAYTGKRDAKIQEVARTISDAHVAQGLFQVIVYSWDDIVDRLGDHVEVWLKHNADIVAAALTCANLSPTAPDLTPLVDDARVPNAAIRRQSVILPGSTSLDQTEYLAEIQLVQAALAEGQARVALSQAETLRVRIWSRACGETRAQLLVLVGHALLEIGDVKNASKTLTEATQHAPRSADVQAQVALGHYIAGNASAARTWAAKALEQNPSHMLAVQIAISTDLRADEEILAEYDRVVGPRAEVFAVLGQRAADRGDLAKALQWFDKALELDDSHKPLLVGTAQVLVNIVAEEIRERVHDTAVDSLRLARAVGLLDSALKRAGDDESRRAKVSWYATRVTAKRMLRSPDAAAAADEAIQICGQVPELLRLRVALAAEVGENDKVVSLLELLPKPLDVDDKGLMAAALANLGRFANADAIWKEILGQPDLTEFQRYEAMRNYAMTLVLERREADAKLAVESAIESEPKALLPRLVAISIYERLDDIERRDALLESAVNAAADGSVYLLSLLGDALARAERWADASEIYLKVVPDGTGSVYQQRLIRSLFQAGRFESVLNRCETVVAATGPSEFLSEIRSATYESLGDLERAISVCRDYLAVDPKSDAIGLRLAAVHFRRGDLAEAGRVIDSLEFGKVRSIHGLGVLVQVLVGLGRPRDAIDVAYSMRSQYMESAEAHLNYVSVYMATRHSLQDVDRGSTIGVGVAVQLTGRGAPGWVFLVDSPQGNVSEKEYPRSHELARLLVGRRIGDRIPVAGVGGEWEIADVGSKYGFAFGRTLERFSSHFPTNVNIQQQEVPVSSDAMVAHFREQFERNNSSREAMLAHYRAGECGVGRIASMLNRTAYESVFILLASARGLPCSSNSLEERNNSLAVLNTPGTPLLLDLTAIVALDGVGALRDGTLSNRKLWVAQRTIDDLHSESLRWLNPPTEGSMQIGMVNGQLVKCITTSEEIVATHSYLSGLTEWLRANVQTMSVRPETAERFSSLLDTSETIGQAFWDTIRIGAQGGATLISDDLWLRRVAKTSFGLDGACSGMLLMSELQSGRLARQKYDEAVTRLIASGYQGLPVSASILEAAAQMDEWQVGSVVRKVLACLRGPETSMETAIPVGVEFIRMVWLNVVLVQRRSTFLIAVLDSLIAGRNRTATLKGFTTLIQHLLALHPLALDEIIRIADGWEKMGIVNV